MSAYASRVEDLVDQQRARYTAWFKAMDRAGVERRLFAQAGGNLHRASWNPVRLSHHGTVEIRSMDANYPEMVLAVCALICGAAERIRRERLEVRPGRGVFTVEPEGDLLRVPTFSYLSGELLSAAVTGGVQDRRVEAYVDSVVRFASPYLEAPELVGQLVSSGGYETTEHEILVSFPTRDASVTQEEGLSLVRQSCCRLDERVSSLRRRFGATLSGGGLEERAANVVSIRDSPTVPAAHSREPIRRTPGARHGPSWRHARRWRKEPFTMETKPVYGGQTLTEGRQIQSDNLSIPDYVASRGARLEGILGRVSDAPLRDGNSIALLKNGPDTYDDWLQAIASAQRWIHLDNYIIANDEVGNRFADALSAKASEGVRVRVLHDWFGCMDVPRSFWRGMREAGVEVKAVNPPASGPPLGAIRRDHRKLLVVDGEYASTGGVCIAEGWLVTSPETGLPYRDTAVSVRGPVVADINRAFTSLWGELVAKLPDDERPDPGAIQAAGETPARLVVQEPRRLRTLRMLELLTAGVQERLWITDPYFLSMPILTQSLMATARDGVDVRVLTPATNNIAWIGSVSRAGYRQFLESGVRIFEYGGPMIHAKTLVADGWWSKVGSTNLNFSSLVANWEIDLVVEDEGFARQMEELFEDDISKSREVRLEGSGQRRRVRPERQVDTSDSRARAGVVGGGTGSGATVARVVPTLVQKGAAPLQTHEHAIAAAASGALLGASLLGARFPRLVAWPLVAVGAFLGGLGVLRAIQSTLSDGGQDQDAP